MAFSDQAALAINTTFRDKVKVAMETAATQIQGEAKGVLSQAIFDKRQTLASKILDDPTNAAMLDMFVWGAVSNAAITSSSTDSDVQFQINSIWNDIAHVTSQE